MNFDEIEGKNKKNVIIQGITNNNLFNNDAPAVVATGSVADSTAKASILAGGISEN